MGLSRAKSDAVKGEPALVQTHYPHSPVCPSYGVALCGASVSPIPAGPDPFRSTRIDCAECLGARPAEGIACCAEARGRFELMARPYVGAGPA